MPVHEKAQRPRFLFIESQTDGDFFRQPFSDVAMIFLLPLTEIVHQHCQMENVFAFDPSVHFSQHACVLTEGFRAADGQQAMLVHRVFMVLIELHQAADRAHGRH